VRKSDPIESQLLDVVKPHVKWGESIRMPIRLFPYVDSSMLHNFVMEGKAEPPYQLVLPEMRGKYLLLRPAPTIFESWRKMLWVGKKGYGLYITTPSFEIGMGCVLQAAVPLPWNMRPDEILIIEDRVVSDHQNVLRALYRKKVKVFPKTARFISKNGFPTLCAMLQQQKEFTYKEVSEKDVMLIRNWDAHPAFSENAYVKDFWERMLKERDSDKAFVAYRRFVVDLHDKGFYY